MYESVPPNDPIMVPMKYLDKMGFNSSTFTLTSAWNAIGANTEFAGEDEVLVHLRPLLLHLLVLFLLAVARSYALRISSFTHKSFSYP